MAASEQTAFWRGKDVAITGACGYLGRALAQDLAERGASLVLLDRVPADELEDLQASAKVEFRRGDLLDPAFVETVCDTNRFDVCFHLAGQPGVAASHADPMEAFASNCQATWVLLDALRRYAPSSRIVVVSSNHVYGEQTTFPTTEEAPLRAEEVYGASKACGDVVAQGFARAYGLPLAIARITNTFGGEDPHSDHLVTGTLRSLLAGEAPVIRCSGKDVKGFLYLADTLRALRIIAERLDDEAVVGEAFNLCPDEPISVLDLVRTMMRVAGREHLSPIVLDQSPGPPEYEHLSNAKAKALLGWEPQYSLEAGLKEALETIRG